MCVRETKDPPGRAAGAGWAAGGNRRLDKLSLHRIAVASCAASEYPVPCPPELSEVNLVPRGDRTYRKCKLF